MNETQGNKQLYLGHARSPQQTANMEQIIADGVCPFCSEHLSTYHEAPILYEGEHWILTANDFPYEYTRRHLLLIPKVHAECLAQLPDEAGNELFAIAREYEQALDISGGTLIMRFGEPAETGGTIRHLHVHMVVPDLDSIPPGEALRVKVSHKGSEISESDTTGTPNL